MQIAAHALHVKATLVSCDQAFMNVDQLMTENWMLQSTIENKRKISELKQ
jgi:hypothetical protein